MPSFVKDSATSNWSFHKLFPVHYGLQFLVTYISIFFLKAFILETEIPSAVRAMAAFIPPARLFSGSHKLGP